MFFGHLSPAGVDAMVDIFMPYEFKKHIGINYNSAVNQMYINSKSLIIFF